MFRKLLVVTSMVAFLSGAAFAGAPSKDKGNAKKPVKTTQVMVCPMTGEAVHGVGGGHEAVGNYVVHFCCAGCQPDFDKLSKKDKEKKIAEALKKQKGAQKKS